MRGKVPELLLLLQTCSCGCQLRVRLPTADATVAALNQTVSRFWRWREYAFQVRAVTWKEAAEALLTLAADDMWVRGGTKQKMVAGPGLSGLAGGERGKQTLFLCGHIFVL